MAKTVLVTGGTGYIAGFLIRQLSAEGWTIHTTIRSLSKESGLRATLDVDNDRLKVFAADLMSDDGWAEAVAGCSHVAHLASPLPSAVPKNDDELIVPAREGALRALRFAKAEGVKRFVMTSSMAAVSYGVGRGEHHSTEADWTDIDHPDAYAYVKSKTIAERAARDFVEVEGGDMEYCTINPSLVLGPQMSDDFSTSLELIKKLMDGSFPGTPDLSFSIVDVRDTADLHARALTADNMAGERFLAAGKTMHIREIAELLKAGLGDQGKRIPTRKLPDWLLKLLSIFDPVVRQVVSELGKTRLVDASHAKEVLGWETRPAEESIMDTANDLLRRGIV